MGGFVGLLAMASCPSLASPPAESRPASTVSTPECSAAQAAPGRVELSGGVRIVLPTPASPVAVHAGAYLRSELLRDWGIESVMSDSCAPTAEHRVQVILGEAAGTDPRLAEVADLPPAGADGYVLRVSAERRRVVLIGGSGNGLIRGAFALAQLTFSSPGGCAWPVTTLCDTPELPIRMTRDILSNAHPPANMTREDKARCQFDWWARWGLNYTFLPSSSAKALPADTQYARWCLREAHDRGMRAGANLGGRSLCASDPVEMAAYLEQARHLLAIGCDFLSVLFDDLPSARTAGHCDRCVKQFGGSLAREQRHILEALQKTLEAFGPDRQLIWCPTYYSLGMTGYQNAAEGPEAYFSILGESAPVRKAWMYHCAFDGTFNAYLDSKGLTRRIWWYNGIRTYYYMVSRKFDGYDGWGERLTIPGVKDFHSFFSPFEHGWLMPSFNSADPSLHPCVAPLVTASRDALNRTVIPQESWSELRQIAARMDGVYFCGANTPYHIGLTGVFAAHPQRFDARQAERMVMTAMFGAQGQPIAERWQAAYGEVQMILARAQGRPLSGRPLQELQDRTATMTAMEGQLRTGVRAKELALPRAVLEALLDEMTTWRQRAQDYATESSRVSAP